MDDKDIDDKDINEVSETDVEEKKGTKCVISGEIIQAEQRIVRLYVEKSSSPEAALNVSLTIKKQKNAVYFLLTEENIQKIIKDHSAVLPDDFNDIPQTEFDQIPFSLKETMQNKLLASMGFALKTKKAVIGKRAIDRQINLFPHMVSDIFVAEDASEEIARKFQERGPEIRFTMNFPTEWIQKISARDKASYFLLKKNYTNHHIHGDYMHYQMLTKMASSLS